MNKLILLLLVNLVWCPSQEDVPELVTKQAKRPFAGFEYNETEYFRGDVKILLVSECPELGSIYSSVFSQDERRVYEIVRREGMHLAKRLLASNEVIHEIDANLDGRYDIVIVIPEDSKRSEYFEFVDSQMLAPLPSKVINAANAALRSREVVTEQSAITQAYLAWKKAEKPASEK